MPAAPSLLHLILCALAAPIRVLLLSQVLLAGPGSPLRAASALSNGVALTPPMGYNTWNDLGCDRLHEDVLTEIVPTPQDAVLARAQELVDSGLAALGYEYVNIDDCWQAAARGPPGDGATAGEEGAAVASLARDGQGAPVHAADSPSLLRPDPAKFPGGMASLAGKVHALGLKLGLYTDRGTRTCAGRPGSLGFEDTDAQTFAAWGVDYLKVDNCWAAQSADEQLRQFGLIRDALNRTGRPILYSVCGGGSTWPFVSDLSYFARPPFGGELGNTWRISPDVIEGWTYWHAVVSDANLSDYSGPGGWNDADMLLSSSEAARKGGGRTLSPVQSRTQFALYAVLAAPLLLGGQFWDRGGGRAVALDPGLEHDFRTYSNKDVIRISQQRTRQGVVGYLEWLSGMRLVAMRELGADADGADRQWALIGVNNYPWSADVVCDAACWLKFRPLIGDAKRLRMRRVKWGDEGGGVSGIAGGAGVRTNVVPGDLDELVVDSGADLVLKGVPSGGGNALFILSSGSGHARDAGGAAPARGSPTIIL